MLFLLNGHILQIDAPERHLDRFWRRLGCGEPARITAEQAVRFSVMVVNEHLLDGIDLGPDTQLDLASLIISKTGANAALFDGSDSARLNILSEGILENLNQHLAAGRDVALTDYWNHAA